jgi:hypothetical protein
MSGALPHHRPALPEPLNGEWPPQLYDTETNTRFINSSTVREAESQAIFHNHLIVLGVPDDGYQEV